MYTSEKKPNVYKRKKHFATFKDHFIIDPGVGYFTYCTPLTLIKTKN